MFNFAEFLKLPGKPQKPKNQSSNKNEDGEDDADDEGEGGHGSGTVPETPSTIAGSSTQGDDSDVFATPQQKARKRNYPASRKPRSVPTIDPNDDDTGFVSSSTAEEIRNRVLSVEAATKRKEDKLRGKRVSYSLFPL